MDITKKEGYYYLKHSYRKGNRIITKEKYIGKEIPKDIEARKQSFLLETKKEFYFRLNKIRKGYKKEWKTYPQSVKKEIIIDLSIDFTYNTNAIEGSTITRDETEDIIRRKLAPNKQIRDIQETINHAKVFFEMMNEKKDLSLSLICEWHKKIFSDSKPDIAGELRGYNLRVGDYRCPDWQDVASLMAEFFEWYNKNKNKEHPVEFAAMVHYKFVKIHPFGDGNGRISRLMANFVLHKHIFPLLIIEYKKRSSYYKALRKNEQEFVMYFTRRYLSSHKKYLKHL